MTKKDLADPPKPDKPAAAEGEDGKEEGEDSDGGLLLPEPVPAAETGGDRTRVVDTTNHPLHPPRKGDAEKGGASAEPGE